MNKSQKEAKREKCFCQIKEMAYFWTPVNGCAYISSAFMPDSSRQQAQEITEPTRPVADETFDKFDDRCQKNAALPIGCPARTCQENARVRLSRLRQSISECLS
ncbi:hypothetical protein [Coprobacter secundus]|uniref:hypothetical protein n=1 Tax=Coprobacter secundus TaxID=1501392 RepID=UPI00351FB2F9